MSKKRQYKSYSHEFKAEAVALVTEQGYSVPEAAASLDLRTNQLDGWKKKWEELMADNLLIPEEKAELLVLRKEVKQLRIVWMGQRSISGYRPEIYTRSMIMWSRVV